MSYADARFKETCRDILENGTSTQGQNVRAKWADGSFAYTFKKSCVCDEYDLRKEFPALTLRKVFLKSCMDEILWIYQRKSNNIGELKPHIWDSWADENGSIGKAYGYQIRQKFIFKKIKGLDNFHMELSKVSNFFGPKEPLPSATFCFDNETMEYLLYLDQMDSVLYMLKFEPFNRRIMTNTWNFNDLSEMGLQPCAYNMLFSVEKDKSSDKLILNGLLMQRSQDMLAANGWNVCQYAIFLMMVAQVSDMVPGKFVHVINDCHIYDKHVPMIEELLKREEFDAPKVSLNPEIKNFYKFTTDDLNIEDYKFGEQIKNIPVAI